MRSQVNIFYHFYSSSKRFLSFYRCQVNQQWPMMQQKKWMIYFERIGKIKISHWYFVNISLFYLFFFTLPVEWE
jgi:hypothetical protein